MHLKCESFTTPCWQMKSLHLIKTASIIQIVLNTCKSNVDVERLQLPQRSCASDMWRDQLTVNNAHKATMLCEASSLHSNTDRTTKNQKKLGGIRLLSMMLWFLSMNWQMVQLLLLWRTFLRNSQLYVKPLKLKGFQMPRELTGL